MYLYRTSFEGKVIYLYLLCVAFADGQHEVDILVNGDMVVQTNVTTYTIYDPRNSQRTLTISCLSLHEVNATVSLLRNGNILNDTFEQSIYKKPSLITQFTYIKSNVTNLQGVYACRFNFSLSTHNGSHFEHYIESEIEINTTTISEVCASSIGFSGYLKEKVTLLCGNSEYSLLAKFFQADQDLRSRYSLQVSLLRSQAKFTCYTGTIYGLAVVCSHDFKVYQSLKINISPNHFIVDSHKLTFSCNSTPPRLLYWELIGDDENILNLSSIADLPKAAGINIEIIQRAGWSSLRISTSAGGNINLDIQKVVCFTYGTRSVAYASRELVLQNGTTASADTSTRSPQTTTPSFGYATENATTTIFSTNGTPTEQEKTDDVQEPTNDRQCSDNVTTNKEKINKEEEINKKEEIHKEEETNKTGEINQWMISAMFAFAIASFEALLLVIIVGICASRKCRTGDKNQSSKSGFTGDIISSETELHENPVYQAYECDS